MRSSDGLTGPLAGPWEQLSGALRLAPLAGRPAPADRSWTTGPDLRTPIKLPRSSVQKLQKNARCTTAPHVRLQGRLTREGQGSVGLGRRQL
jgi:hypothetical protein